MRVGISRIWAALCGLVVMLCTANADDSKQTVFVSTIPGFALFVFSEGEKPCDWSESKLQNDAEFVLNTASIDFVNFTNSGN